jgi:hypothetical protein
MDTMIFLLNACAENYDAMSIFAPLHPTQISTSHTERELTRNRTDAHSTEISNAYNTNSS